MSRCVRTGPPTSANRRRDILIGTRKPRFLIGRFGPLPTHSGAERRPFPEEEPVPEPRQLPNGRWKIRYRDPEGRQRSKTCRTKSEARAYLEDVGHAGRQRTWVAPERGRITLAAWSEQYMTTVVHLRPTSISLYERELVHILARFGRTQLAQLDPLAIQAWLAQLLAGGMASSSVHRKYGVLRRILQVAVRKGVIATNPCTAVDPPTLEAGEMSFLNPSELASLVEEIDPWYQAFVYTAAETGMRWSELVGLRRRGVDLLRRSIAVTEQMVLVWQKGRPGRWVRQKPKTKAGTRSISISAFLAERLGEQLASRSQPGLDGLVFVNKRGGPVGSSIFHTRHWAPARRAVGLDGLRFHDLRHTAVALAISQGAHPKAIQRRMGHSTINMTLDRYGHLFPELDEQIADHIGSLLSHAETSRTAGTTTPIRRSN